MFIEIFCTKWPETQRPFLIVSCAIHVWLYNLFA